MIVYLVGTNSIVDRGKGTEVDEPFYFGYTTNPNIADRYYEALIAKCKKDIPSTTVTDVYFIQQMSESVFAKRQSANLMYLEEIEEYPDGTVMTASDYENYCDWLGASFDEIAHHLFDGDIKDFTKRLSRFASFSTDKELKSSVRKFKHAVKELKTHFGECEGFDDCVDWDKIQRKV